MKLGWVDFSPEDRKRAIEALDSLRERGAVDELGIGAVRDAFAEFFFPGTSTLQTKPKYFVLVPRAIRAALESVARKPGDRSVFDELRRQEHAVATQLWKSAGSRMGGGVIGGTRLDRDWRDWIAGVPSSVYWSGLRTFGIVDESGSESLRAFLEEKASAAVRGDGNRHRDRMDEDDEGVFDAEETRRKNWRSGFNIDGAVLGDVTKANWFDGLSMELTPVEADWLRERILEAPNSRDSLLAFCIRERIRITKPDNRWSGWISPFEAFCKSVRPRIAESRTRALLDHACAFARLVFVGRVLYNRILGKDAAFEIWNEIEHDIPSRVDIELPSVFATKELRLARHASTCRFLMNLQAAFRSRNWKAAEKCLEERESEKEKRTGAPAKLLNPDKRTQDRDWIGGLWLDYRLSSAREITEGIRKALRNGKGRHRA